ncbi:hypothetical protein S83_014324 [Arachis hypogaea]|nr:uncharacterized protein DS421_5g170980 [Arachis hypogaea]
MVTDSSSLQQWSFIFDDSLSRPIRNTLFSSGDAAHRDRSSTSCVFDPSPVRCYRFAAVTDATPSRSRQ